MKDLNVKFRRPVFDFEIDPKTPSPVMHNKIFNRDLTGH